MAKIPGKNGAKKSTPIQMKRTSAKSKSKPKSKPSTKPKRAPKKAVAPVARESRRFDVRSRAPRAQSIIVPPPAAAPAADRPILPTVAVLEAPPVEVPHELVARRSYEIWEAKIRRANDAAANWLEAEAELRANYLPPPATAAAATAAAADPSGGDY